ncbi:helix-turn-helix domain-containing protein [Flammeovirga yaeyamensis]|uniref:Helix-turn-helix domain-containing protein n=1 Tax=Flammeovirga yaeyamensis TaxID=367791 RepID=A0AAX1NC75_9BACT|nr:helix-turn-helix domain-containing protein [Flammeovirga yaeyamensis]MBB3698907.1 transposase-like protein [Flammeovirga yaeyamensis]NMF36342.1 IS1 family transposase [Flammeovirga yaeyamensis]QWG03697.1 helix-turn-helix domain-containing protein [Flammeovirga yaeyamensis]
MLYLQSECPKCHHDQITKSGMVKGKQRYKCKKCSYNFTVPKLGKEIDHKYVIKALQLYLEGVSYREIERILGVSHVTVMNWVKKYNIPKLEKIGYNPQYQMLNHSELLTFVINKENLEEGTAMITNVGAKYMVISWEKRS